MVRSGERISPRRTKSGSGVQAKRQVDAGRGKRLLHRMFIKRDRRKSKPYIFNQPKAHAVMVKTVPSTARIYTPQCVAWKQCCLKFFGRLLAEGCWSFVPKFTSSHLQS